MRIREECTNMKCKICSALLLMLMFVSVFPINVNAKEKHFEKQEIKGVSVIDETSLMRVDAKGNVGFVQYSSSCKANNLILKKKQIKGNKIRSAGKVSASTKEEDMFDCVKSLDKCIITVENCGKFAVINEYDNEGKRIFAYKDKVYKVNRCYYTFGDIWDDGENIYYVYWSRYFDNNRESGATLRCINKKNKKAKTINAFKTKNNVCIDNTITIDDGYIYELCESNVYVYSFNGKKVCRINLPSGKQSLYEEGIDSEEYKYLINHSLSVCGDYIYYCNKNGVYACNMKKAKKFHIFYDGSKDQYFGHDYGVKEICVKDKNTFYIRFTDKSVYEPCGEINKSILVKYSNVK